MTKGWKIFIVIIFVMATAAFIPTAIVGTKKIVAKVKK